jgi:hypothetical protein
MHNKENNVESNKVTLLLSSKYANKPLIPKSRSNNIDIGNHNKEVNTQNSLNSSLDKDSVWLDISKSSAMNNFILSSKNHNLNEPVTHQRQYESSLRQ